MCAFADSLPCITVCSSLSLASGSEMDLEGPRPLEVLPSAPPPQRKPTLQAVTTSMQFSREAPCRVRGMPEPTVGWELSRNPLGGTPRGRPGRAVKRETAMNQQLAFTE